MTDFEKCLFELSKKPLKILDDKIPVRQYTPIDLSTNNEEITKLDISEPAVCQNYIDKVLKRSGATVAFGGYLEKRNLYKVYNSFQKEEEDPRNRHLGIDFWAPAGTLVRTIIPGKVHSFKNNTALGDYGPTIVLEHKSVHRRFYTLYGHLSANSIKELYPGKQFQKGDTLGWLGQTTENVNYAPHLHFQIILDITDYRGDYPGVSNAKQLEYYKKNCPDPNLLLKL